MNSKILNIKRIAVVIWLFSLVFHFDCIDARNKSTLYVVGSETNDIVKTLRSQKNVSMSVFPTIDRALSKISKNDALLVLSNQYPQKQVELNQKIYQQIVNKKIRAFIEFPSFVPGVSLGKIQAAQKERAVVCSNFFNGIPDSLGILSVNGLHYVNVMSTIKHPFMVAAKVAGFDTAIYGLPTKTIPVLFQLDASRILISTTNFSNFITGRYAPQREWKAIWEKIINYLLPRLQVRLNCRYTVSTSYSKNEKLPSDYLTKSIQRGVNWYNKARLLISASDVDTIKKMMKVEIERRPWNKNQPVGDGSNGLFECIFSEIDEKGNQPVGLITRGDCVSETAMAFAASGMALHNEDYYNITRNLLDFYLYHSIASKNEYGDPNHSAYGLIPWGISNYPWYRASYGDDNARFFLAAIVSSAILKTDRWNKPLMKSLLALWRTTGKNGFRGERIDLPDFAKNGWKYYHQRDIINLSPHFEAYLWACYLWAYDKTGDKIFLYTAEKGLKTMMAHYTDDWEWTNGLAQERARMILPLSWLVRVNPSEDNKKMLLRVVDDFLKLQDSCGAIMEELEKIKKGKFPPPQSNEAYGTSEASLISKNGEKVSDLLYTTNFAFLGLHEASYALNDPRIKDAVSKLEKFLCRIQVKSAQHPEIDGGWMRSFDFNRFEHWGSNSDSGWGAWVIESGWTQGWITSILSLRKMNMSIWDLTHSSTVNQCYPGLKAEMLPQ